MTKNHTSKKILLAASLSVFALLYLQMKPVSKMENACAARLTLNAPDSLFEGANLEFSSAGKCDHCHGSDPMGIANVDGEGGDVNVIDDWSSSMMALSAKDPYWRAKVSEEVFVNPLLQQEIESTCTKCHAPLGHFAATMHGATHYSIADMLADSVALDGVSCTACHSQLPQPEVALHTGQLLMADDSVVYGPYYNPLITPMALYSGYTPEQADHISDAKLCAACHSLVTETVDLNGALTGNHFVEQATWHEWLNSSYSTNSTTCQKCHVPQLPDQMVRLATGYMTPPRGPYGLHTLAGGNVTMLQLMRDNREQLGIYPSEAQFDETINATRNMLQEQSLQMEVTEINRTADTLYIDVKLTNLVGHKMPSGYPARRMTVVLYAEDPTAFTEIFRSGGFDEEFYVLNEDAPFEQHHNVINDEEQVQIYEMVIGDVAGNKTTILTRANSALKDNRLVPLGFAETGTMYDTTAIVLNTTDADFNHSPNVGSGTDVIHYRIPTNGLASELNVHAAVYYQSVPPGWTESFASVTTEEVATFNSMFSTTDQTPVLMKEATVEVAAYIGINANTHNTFASIRNSGPNQLTIAAAESMSLTIYDVKGNLIDEKKYAQGKHTYTHQLAKGMYMCIMRSASGIEKVEKIIVR
jgi:nitrate reductase cytochrome c-type subunit